MQRRRRSSLAQLTDLLREWSGGVKHEQAKPQRSTKAPLNRRETLADLARSLPWRTSVSDAATSAGTTYVAPRKRRESSCESGLRSTRSRRDSNTAEFVKHWNRRESTADDTTTLAVNVVIEPSKGVSTTSKLPSFPLFQCKLTVFSLYINYYPTLTL